MFESARQALPPAFGPGSSVVLAQKRPPSGVPDWRGALERLQGAYALATLRAYRADFQTFETWCLDEAVCPLPATPDIVAAYLASEAERFAAATLKRRVASLRKVHRLLGFPTPTDAEAVTVALRRALRSKPRRPEQALGLKDHLRDQLVEHCPESLRGLRDKALILVGYDTLCRRSELVALCVEDVAELPAGGAKVMVRRGKSDPFGEGRWASLSPAALAQVQAWLILSGIAQGPIFRPILGGRVGQGGLSSIAVNRTLKRAASRAGLERSFSGHSMRVGAAQDLMTAGRTLLQIMTAGGWTSASTVGRYVSQAEANIWTV